MTKKRDIHVVPHERGWAIVKEGADRPSKILPTQQEAKDIAREQAKRERVDMIPHKRDGTISNPNSYGNDPMPPRDKKH